MVGTGLRFYVRRPDRASERGRRAFARGVIGVYAMLGAPPFAVTAHDLATGDEMTLEPPDDADLHDPPLPR